MNSFTDKLVSIGSAPISRRPVAGGSAVLQRGHGQAIEGLLSLLTLKNGFYAFESALHVLPLGQAQGAVDLDRWNSQSTWRYEYADLASGLFFFAEDAFGNQFCLDRGRICCFNAETGSLEPLAETIEEWAERILADFEGLTGFTLLHDWQVREGALPLGTRLMPKIPFVLGGEFLVENLYSLSAVSVMRTCGNLARQIKDLPDGTQVEFRVID